MPGFFGKKKGMSKDMMAKKKAMMNRKNGIKKGFISKKLDMGKGDSRFFTMSSSDLQGRGNSDIDLLASEFKNNNPFMNMGGNGKKKKFMPDFEGSNF